MSAPVQRDAMPVQGALEAAEAPGLAPVSARAGGPVPRERWQLLISGRGRSFLQPAAWRFASGETVPDGFGASGSLRAYHVSLDAGLDPWVTAEVPLRARWCEVGPGGARGDWNGPYLVPAHHNACNPPGDVPGPGMRVSAAGFRLELQPVDESLVPARAVVQLSAPGSIFTPEELEAIAAELGDPALLSDPRARGLARTELARAQQDVTDVLSQAASALQAVWPELRDVCAQALGACPPQLQRQSALGRPGAGRPGASDRRRNVREGRTDLMGLPLEGARGAQQWSRQATEVAPPWWPALRHAADAAQARRDDLANLMVQALSGPGAARRLRDHPHWPLAEQLARVAQERGLHPSESPLDLQMQALRAAPPLLHRARAQALDRLPAAQGARVLNALPPGTPSAVQRAVRRLADLVPQTPPVTAGQARRTEWEIYQAYMVHGTLRALAELGFQVQGAWEALTRPGAHGDLIAWGAQVVVAHRDGNLSVRLSCERRWVVPARSAQAVEETGQLPLGEEEPDGRPALTYRPDLTLEIEPDPQGGYLDGPGAPALMPLILDAKCRNLHGLDGLRATLAEVRKYRAIAPHGRSAMAFAVTPRGRSARGQLLSAQAWPAAGDRLPPGEALEGPFVRQVPPGLHPSDLPMRSGVLEFHPTLPRTGTPEQLDFRRQEQLGDLRRVLIAWLMRQGIVWICQGCGCDLSTHAHAELRRAASNVSGTKLLRNFKGDNVQERIGRIRPPWAPFTPAGPRGALRLGQRTGQALVCPECDLLWVYSRCSDRQCPGDDSAVPGRSAHAGILRYAGYRPGRRPGWIVAHELRPTARPWLAWQINQPTGWLRFARSAEARAPQGDPEALWTDGVGGQEAGQGVVNFYNACACCGSVLTQQKDPWEIDNPTPRTRLEARRRVSPWRDISR